MSTLEYAEPGSQADSATVWCKEAWSRGEGCAITLPCELEGAPSLGSSLRKELSTACTPLIGKHGGVKLHSDAKKALSEEGQFQVVQRDKYPIPDSPHLLASFPASIASLR
ncbi:hypothetical protein Y1Q_0012140 [Alligator mississippiensis]|uniref:Uncharacterized protein n=1 Tax=Alligator mississippiensis TaxID=8496 RepID=A0A151P5N1_ALLMI|nr:hypothetical protein Y1Q_0012140 [Alligator mississippiensis]